MRTPPVEVGSRVELDAVDLVAGGDAIARISGFPVFVPSLYPGDRARVEIVEVKSGFARGVVEDLLFAGPQRRTLPCPIAGECGGCDWTELRLDYQLDAKRRILLDSLRRVGKFEPDALPSLAVHPSPLNYRLRSRLHFANDDRRPGFFAMRTNRVVPLSSECEVVGPQTLHHLADLENIAKGEPGGGSIETFENGADFAASVTGNEEDAAEVEIDVAGFHYELSTAAFFQVNRHLLTTMIRTVSEIAEGTKRKKTAFDLYAGAGFFTLPLAKMFEEVFSVEASPSGHRFAKRNTAAYPNVRLDGRTVEAFLRGTRRKADFVFVDPPRAGIHSSVSDAIGESAAETVCYLSCDPVTFARDASRLSRRGWKLTRLHLLDLFPNTHHIETLSSFERAS